MKEPESAIILKHILMVVSKERKINYVDILNEHSQEVVLARRIYFYVICKIFPTWKDQYISLFVWQSRTASIKGFEYIDEKINSKVQHHPENIKLKSDVNRIMEIIKSIPDIQKVMSNGKIEA
jgi:hypothetical protein